MWESISDSKNKKINKYQYMAKRYTVRVNSIEKLEELLQEVYNQACQELNEVQNEINKLGNSTLLTDATIEEKTKYAKAMNDFTVTKMKTIQMKFEIAKFMGELIKHNGDLNGTLTDPVVSKNTKLDITAWRNIVNDTQNTPETQVYDLK